MVNKLRTLTRGGGGLLIVLTTWAFFRYGQGIGDIVPYLKMAVLGVVIILLPRALVRAKIVVITVWRMIEHYRSGSTSFSRTRGTTFISEAPLADPEAVLGEVTDIVQTNDMYDDVKRDEFPEGEGLTVTHTGFHNTFVRISKSARLVLTGASKKTRALADDLEEGNSMSFREAYRNPFRKPRSVEGAPRVFFGLFVFILILAGTMGVADAAYPTVAYNPAEKTVLLTLDARTALDPTVSETDNRLAKAEFMVKSLEEEAVEIQWDRSSPEAAASHGEQATLIAQDIRGQLTAVRSSSPTPEQAARADRVETELYAAEETVSEALESKANAQVNQDAADRFLEIQKQFRAAGNASRTSESNSTATSNSS